MSFFLTKSTNNRKQRLRDAIELNIQLRKKLNEEVLKFNKVLIQLYNDLEYLLDEEE